MPETKMNTAACVPMEIEFQGTWLSWVGSTTMCLNALGIQCDMADVAGYSGYAFAISINPGLCPSGPTDVDWPALAAGPMSLGRSAMSFICGDCHTEGSRSDRTRAHCRAVFEMVAREIEAGRPCVLWGAGIPEFGVVRGINGDDYLLVKGGPIPQRIAWDAVDAPGGPYALSFPTPVQPDGRRDLAAIVRAVEIMTRPNEGTGGQRGLDAYSFWISRLRAHEAAIMGNSYNAQCWAEARRHAATFLGRPVERTGGRFPPLVEAHEAMHEVADRLSAVAELFPFRAKDGIVDDAASINAAAGHFEAARQAEERALAALKTLLTRIPRG
ncbi:MAG: hypothetical protein SYC29_15320 [Planctomycetota bacterium]|nr:hypothetical protein [Planctomycetota bacterium]